MTTMNWLPVEAILPTEAHDTTVKGVELWMGLLAAYSCFLMWMSASTTVSASMTPH